MKNEFLNNQKNVRGLSPRTLSEYCKDLGYCFYDNAPKIKGWVAVDEIDGKRRVTFFHKPPVRDKLTNSHYWAAHISPYEHVVLDSNLFPNLKWEDGPIAVELLIKLTEMSDEL